ncbi:MAG: DNA/RNA non-specific endonuclease [Flavobacteriaceae bacterium]|nr:DNA/RNA non-specific endonuclease [Flavobacteriaceae bacterium]
MRISHRQFYFVPLFFLTFSGVLSKGEESNVDQPNKKKDFIINGPIFKVSYNEINEQPNWVEYTVRYIDTIRATRIGHNFYAVDSVHTSDDADYYKNIWDKGHLAPVNAFVDSDQYVHETFSYLNCTLQHQSLNRGQWAVLEKELKNRARRYEKEVCVRVEMLFDKESIKLSTGAVVPSGFIKHTYIEGVGSACFQFKNQKPPRSWKEQKIDCSEEISCYSAQPIYR